MGCVSVLYVVDYTLLVQEVCYTKQPIKDKFWPAVYFIPIAFDRICFLFNQLLGLINKQGAVLEAQTLEPRILHMLICFYACSIQFVIFAYTVLYPYEYRTLNSLSSIPPLLDGPTITYLGNLTRIHGLETLELGNHHGSDLPYEWMNHTSWPDLNNRLSSHCRLWAPLGV